MDPEVWKCLLDHEDILRLILCRVSWETNLRLRSVRKAFYATLSEPSVYTWSLMLTDTSFYTDHSSLEWVDGDINAEHLEQSHANAVCFFSPLKPAERVSEEVTLGRSIWKLHLRSEGLLLLERTMSEERSEGRHGVYSLLNKYELDRFLFNPLTKGFIKLPAVPKIKGNSVKGNLRNHLRMIMAVKKELVIVVAVEFHSYSQAELPRILIWHQGSQDWVLLRTTILPMHNTRFLWAGTNALFVGGELLLHFATEEDVNPGMRPTGERVFSFGSLTRAIDPELIWNCNHLAFERTHLFQHNGVLKRLKLEVVTTSYGLRYERTFGGSIDLHTFHCSSRSWQKEESIGITSHILESVSSCSKVAGVFGDILCIRNRHVFNFYNFLSKQWCRCDAKELVNFADFEKTGFLWSPKR
ncbi:hypothetical protein R1sor_003242 [Riccia sorocarpa]|uniref:F-box domain-containing protein n=1 Tax=Riccia sorocarpa TaxID=122646 RepID=A0ABD3H4E5_9MARC